MKKLPIIITLVLVGLWMLLYALPPLAKVTIKVVDENGHPVKDSLVSLNFKTKGLLKEDINGTTDKNGRFSTTAFLTKRYISGGVKKEGYYISSFFQQYIIRNIVFISPWNKEITVVLRPIVNPVPMYVRNHTFLFPVTNKNVGFDLMKADWLPPYGNGIYGDLILRIDRVYKDIDNFDATLTMTFSNPYDGIQIIKDAWELNYRTGSRYRLPRNAPEEGYQSKFIKRVSAGTYGNRAAKDNASNYIFRVRSETDDGKLKRAMYGKILGDIRFGPIGGNGGFELHYYLNPDYTTNLEFDPKRNLFKGLTEVEGVGLP